MGGGLRALGEEQFRGLHDPAQTNVHLRPMAPSLWVHPVNHPVGPTVELIDQKHGVLQEQVSSQTPDFSVLALLALGVG